MSKVRAATKERYRWLAFPLAAFLVSRTLLLVFVMAGPFFGPSLVRGEPEALGMSAHLSPFAHGDSATCARAAQQGDASAAGTSCSPLLPFVARMLGAVLGSVETALLVLSFLLCGLGFVAVYRVFERLRGPEAAKAGVALLAAFPFAYHLSDGSALAALLAFSAWGLLLAMQGRPVACVASFCAGVMAHPACIFATLATATAAAHGEKQGASPRPRWLIPLASGLPALLLLALHHGMHGQVAPRPALAALTVTAGHAMTSILLGVFGALLALGGLLLVRRRGLRLLALAGCLQLGFALLSASPSSLHMLAACWPLFLGWSDLLAHRPSWRTPAIALCAAHQGLLLYGFTHLLLFT